MRKLFSMLALCLSAGLAAGEEAPEPPGPEQWRDVDPANLILIETKYGRTAVELMPSFAPVNAQRFLDLVRAKFYDGTAFYRVIDGFVAQGGIGEGDDKKLAAWPPVKAEFDRAIGDETFTPVGSPDLWAEEIGHVDGFPVGRDHKENREWIVHCPGTLAFARDDNPDTAGTEFYIVIGQAPRRLDRNLTAFGRVIDGMQYLQKLNRGDPEVESGVIQDPAQQDRIERMAVAADLPENERPHYQVMRTEGTAFAKRREERLHITAPFYFRKPPAVLDVCILTAPVRLLKN